MMEQIERTRRYLNRLRSIYKGVPHTQDNREYYTDEKKRDVGSEATYNDRKCMDKVSSEILSLLQNVTNPIISQNYAKDVHSSVLDLKDAIDRTTHIINSAYKKKDISSQESKELQSHCRTTLDCFYRLTERLEAFSNNHLRSTGILLNPSISHTLQKIIKARGSLTHKREPFYIYETTNGNNVCASCDVAPNTYQGECLSIKIEFKKENDTVIFKANLDKLLLDISRGVLKTLNKYYNNLKTHLKSVGSKAT